MHLSPTQFEAACMDAWDNVIAQPPAPILWPIMLEKAKTEELRRLGLKKFQDMVAAIFETDFAVEKSFWLGSGKRLQLADVPEKTVKGHNALVEHLKGWARKQNLR